MKLFYAVFMPGKTNALYIKRFSINTINVQEESTMKVNTTELRRHLSDYLAMANKEEIIITNKGIEIARIISPKQAKKSSLNNLVGILPSLTDEEIEDIKNERISKQ